MQFQADVAGVVAERPTDVESTGRGAAMLAGIGAGLSKGFDDISRMLVIDRRFEPAMTASECAAHVARWQDAVRRARSKL
jgi:glycerol kinase